MKEPNLSDKEKETIEKYGAIPNQKSNFMLKKLQGKDKQRFDSADFEMKKQTNKVPRGPGLNPNKPEIPPEVRLGTFSFLLIHFY